MRVCCEFPEAMFVSAHAASNWIFCLSSQARNWTSLGTMPLLQSETEMWYVHQTNVEHLEYSKVLDNSCTAGEGLCNHNKTHSVTFKSPVGVCTEQRNKCQAGRESGYSLVHTIYTVTHAMIASRGGFRSFESSFLHD